jgi:GT2 family glycosyltransferase
VSAFLRRIGRWLRRRPRQAWLGDSIVLAVGPGRPAGVGEERARASIGGSQVRLYAATGGRGAGAEGDDPGALERLLRDEFRDAGDQGRELMSLMLRAAAPDLQGPAGIALGRDLQRAHEVLRPALPRLINEVGAPVAGAVDAIQAIDDLAFVAIGWLHDPGGMAAGIEALSPEGQRVELLDGAYRRPRPDVEEMHQGPVGDGHGFTRYFELDVPTRLGAEWTVVLRTRSGQSFELNRPVATQDLRGTRGYLLNDFRVSRLSRDEPTFRNAQPALARVQTTLRDQVQVRNIEQYGAPPASPTVSIVVPLYQRIDLVEHQLAHFGRDPEIAQADLIYVLDSPELTEELGRVAPALQELHAVPFRIATLNRNGGYAVANNLGADLARSGLLLLLNSDVLPAAPGWLGSMAAFHAATPDIGALGPKLLFEDDSIQHAGMYFQRDGETALWTNQHYFKGFARSLHAANVTRPVPAVTGACLMLEKALYEQLGGLWHGYIEGGYEDSDLCLRLIDAGRTNWYAAEVELYHLEAQSYRTEARAANSYNSWLQTHLLGERIEEVMRAQADGPDARLLSLERA